MTNTTDKVRAQAWAKLEREWAIDGMPADKIRLARAAFDSGAALAQQPEAPAQEAFGHLYRIVSPQIPATRDGPWIGPGVNFEFGPPPADAPYVQYLALYTTPPAAQEESMRDWSLRMASAEAGQIVTAGAHGIPDEPAAQVQQDDEYLAALDDLYKHCGYDNNHWLYQLFLKFVNTAHPAADALGALRKLSADLRTLAGGETPDGDGVPVNVVLWAEKRLAALEAALVDEDEE